MKVNTENRFSTVQVEYDSEKLEAIRFYLIDKNTTTNPKPSTTAKPAQDRRDDI